MRLSDFVMKTYLDCYPCFLRQSLEAARISGASPELQYVILRQVMDELRSFDPTGTPPEMAYRIHAIIRRETGVENPFREAKEIGTRQALAVYPRLKVLLAEAEDPLNMAVRLSIAGNIIDVGISQTYDLDETIDHILCEPLAIDAYDAFREAVARAGNVLFLADNAGETVFDRVLIETLAKPTAYVVKAGPILNDATRQDALAVGLEKVATIVDSGSDAPGTILEFCSADFRRSFSEAELIIAKGQANYETLSGRAAPIFFMLQVKCPVTARDLGVAVSSAVLKRANNSTF